jgi:hypothetical protein
MMRPASIPGATGSLVVSATAVLYVMLIDAQGSTDPRRVSVWGIALTTCAAVGAVGSWSRQPKVRSISLAVTGGALLGFGWLGIFSIGMLLIVSGALLVVGARTAAAEDPAQSGALAFALGVVALAAAPILLLWIV